MEDSAPSFGIDIIKNSIRDLQEEKEKNERKLSEARSRRRKLESRYEAALSKFNQTTDTKGKMADTLKVAQYKVSQSQAAIESQQSINQELEQRISHLRANKAAEETRQQEEKELLEGKLASLADMFHHGKDFYTDQLLQDEVSSVKNEMQSLTSKVRQTDTEAERLIGLFEALEMVAKKNEDEKGFLGISLETQHQALDLFEQEKKAEEQELVKMKEVERQLLTQLEE